MSVMLTTFKRSSFRISWISHPLRNWKRKTENWNWDRASCGRSWSLEPRLVTCPPPCWLWGFMSVWRVWWLLLAASASASSSQLCNNRSNNLATVQGTSPPNEGTLRERMGDFIREEIRYLFENYIKKIFKISALKIDYSIIFHYITSKRFS